MLMPKTDDLDKVLDKARETASQTRELLDRARDLHGAVEATQERTLQIQSRIREKRAKDKKARKGL